MSGLFGRTMLWVVVGVVAVSLVVAAALTILGDDLGERVPEAGADTYSRSAIGHAGLVALLEELEVAVVRSRHASAEKARDGLLVVAEPLVEDDAARERLRGMVREAPRVLLVLPKWYGQARYGEPWIESASFVPEREVERVLETLDLDGEVRRLRAPTGLHVEDLGGALPAQLAGPREPQLLASGAFVPMVFDGEGILLGSWTLEATGREVWVLSDPDVLNNHGLRRADNARFIVALIDHLRDGGPVVFDETSHGYAQAPSLLRTLFRFPLVLATLQVLICALLAVWAAMVRFGPRRAAPPPIAPGKDFLIENTAALLHYGGHHADALRRYFAQSVAAVRHALHAPDGAPAAMAGWLDRVGAARGVADSLEALARDAELADTPQRTLEVADRVHRWRMEMTHGARERP